MKKLLPGLTLFFLLIVLLLPSTSLSRTVFKTSEFNTSEACVSMAMAVPDALKESELKVLSNDSFLNVDKVFSSPMLMSAIISEDGCDIGPLWGVYTAVCCQSSSLKFLITVSGETRGSTAASCTAEPTWHGWEETTAGTKSVFWQITSPTCGTYSGTFPWFMEKGKFYGFQLELRDNYLVIMVYSDDACTLPPSPEITEYWKLALDDGQGSSNLTLIKKQDGTSIADGNWTYNYLGSDVSGLYTEASVTIAESSILITASGIATNPSAPPGYQTSPFTLTIIGTALDGKGSGTFTTAFQSVGWPDRISGSWEGKLRSGGGITAVSPKGLPWIMLLLKD